MRRTCNPWRCVVAVCALALAGEAQGQIVGWPEVYDPFRLLDLRITMAPGDLATIRSDTTFDIEKPAMFALAGEEPIEVSIRRKSADPIGGKIAYKIDVNEYFDDQKWHGVRKLSLENGDDQDVISEGLAWHMHRQAAAMLGNGYTSGFANWATLTINGQSEGIYVNVEQVDKTFLKNHGIYQTRATWLYKQSDVSHPTLKVEPPDANLVNTTMEALDYSPFNNSGGLPTPDEATLAAQLPELIDMDTMLTLGALDGFVGNGDALFSHGKNFYHADYVEGRRVYLPWDLDSTIRSTNLSVYGSDREEYTQIILDHPVFRRQFNEIMLDLLDGPLAADAIIAFLDQLEPVLTPALEADQNSKVGDDVAGHFEQLREWIVRRGDNVRGQLLADLPMRGDANGDGVVDYHDYVVVRDNFGLLGGFADGDFDGDGFVGPEDYLLLKRRFGRGPVVVADALLPEPTTFGLLLFGALPLLRWRRPR